jgi:anti-sigma-K factor RskA
MSEIHGAVGSYVVNALDLAELDEFEAHLAVCPTCTREVVEFCETAAELSLLAPAAVPPPSLRSSILSAIKEVRPVPPEVPPPPVVAEPGESTPRRALPGSLPSPDEETPRHEARQPGFDELAVRRQRRRARVLAAAVAAVAAVALALGGVVYNLVQEQRELVVQEQVRAEQERVRAEQERLETELLAAPDARILTAVSGNGGQVSFVVSEDLNRAMVIGSGLPDAGPGNRYQLWTIEGEDPPVPNNQFDAGPDRETFFSGDVADKDVLAISIEEAGVVPTTPSAVLGFVEL